MGFKNTPVIYQNRIMRYLLGETFCRLLNESLLWMDDIYVNGTTWGDFLNTLIYIFERLLNYAVRLNLEKSQLMAKGIVWCGREIGKFGWRFSQEHYNKVLSIPKPVNLAQLEQVIYIIKWLMPTIPNAAPIKDHFQVFSQKIKKIHNLNDRKMRKKDETFVLVSS